MPHSRKASNSSLMRRGKALPVLASVCEMKVALWLDQAVQRGLLRAVAFVVNRGAIRCPLGLPVDGLHAWLTMW